MLPSATQTRVYNRSSWAVTYLTKSMLLDKPARVRSKITSRGVDVLKKNPTRIDNAFLMQFNEFRGTQIQGPPRRTRASC